MTNNWMNHERKWACINVFAQFSEIIGYSTGPYKDAGLVYQTITPVQTDLS